MLLPAVTFRFLKQSIQNFALPVSDSQSGYLHLLGQLFLSFLLEKDTADDLVFLYTQLVLTAGKMTWLFRCKNFILNRS